MLVGNRLKTGLYNQPIAYYVSMILTFKLYTILSYSEAWQCRTLTHESGRKINNFVTTQIFKNWNFFWQKNFFQIFSLINFSIKKATEIFKNQWRDFPAKYQINPRLLAIAALVLVIRVQTFLSSVPVCSQNSFTPTTTL